MYQYNPNQMDAPTLALLLEELEILAHEAMAPSQEGNAKSLWHCLELPANVTRRDLLSEFEARAGTRLEQVLTELACSWVGRMSGWVDHELRSATAILLKIGGGAG